MTASDRSELADACSARGRRGSVRARPKEACRTAESTMMPGIGSIPGMPAPGEKMTQAQKDQLLAQMPAELREQAKAISAAMADLGAICKAVLPPKDDPDQAIPPHQLIMAISSAPSFNALGDHLVPETLDALEKVLITHGAFAEGALTLPEETPAEPPTKPVPGSPQAQPGYQPTPAELYGSWEDPSGKRNDAAIRRNALLIYGDVPAENFRGGAQAGPEDQYSVGPRQQDRHQASHPLPNRNAAAEQVRATHVLCSVPRRDSQAVRPHVTMVAGFGCDEELGGSSPKATRSDASGSDAPDAPPVHTLPHHMSRSALSPHLANSSVTTWCAGGFNSRSPWPT